MRSADILPPETAPEASWRDLRLSLNWCYEGKPLWKKLTSNGVHLVAWHLLAGSVTVESEGKTLRAGRGEWLISRPSRRTHEFTDSARIVSIHVAVECPSLAAGWSGATAMVLGNDKLLWRHAVRLQQTAALRELPQKRRRNLIGLPMRLDHALELREALAAFVRRLFELAAPLGLAFGAPVVRDTRVRLSRQALTARGFQNGWTRASLARAHGLSPSQLDRLWRKELGLTPKQHWEQRRLETACFRLQNETTPVKEIAYDLGFSHLSHFSIWFRGMKGVSPRLFRSRGFAE